jgi:hypothetical protein
MKMNLKCARIKELSMGFENELEMCKNSVSYIGMPCNEPVPYTHDLAFCT